MKDSKEEKRQRDMIRERGNASKMERNEEWKEIESGGDGTKMGWMKDVQN